MAQRRHLQLDRHLPQLLDGPRSAHTAVADEGDRLAVPLDKAVIEGILQRGRIAVVVLGGDDDVAVRPQRAISGVR
jgi:hypothetical protein